MQKYSTIIGVIELRQSGIGYRTTKKRYNIGNSTVTLIMNRFHELGLSLEELKAMPPKKVEEAFYPPENLRRTEKELPDVSEYDSSNQVWSEESCTQKILPFYLRSKKIGKTECDKIGSDNRNSGINDGQTERTPEHGIMEDLFIVLQSYEIHIQ